jgi:SNF2 family DNA or RNA helicase
LRTQALAVVAARARYVALLSGTPMENRPDELARVVRLAQPAIAERLEADALGAGDPQAPARFAATLASVYLRRNQSDVLSELPERLEKIEWVDLRAPELARYRAAAGGRNFAELRRATTLAGSDEPTAKLERIDELLAHHREAGRKVLVFTYFLEVLGVLARRLHPVGVISGDVAPEERMRIVDAFGAAPGHAVLLLQITAGGTGLNLQAAAAVVLVEPQLKPTVEDQAIGRAHRMGQAERVLVHRLIARDTVDEHLLALVGTKRALFDVYARHSALKEASAEAVEASEAGLAARILAAERARLGLADPE